MQVSIHHLILTLSRAVDLVGVTDVYHGRRVGMIAVECAKVMGLDRYTQRRVFDAALLHDCGVSSTQEHSSITDHFDGVMFDEHCSRGACVLAAFGPLSYLAPVVMHHHTFWQDLSHRGLSSDEVLLASLVHLADRVDSLAGAHYRDQTVLLHVDDFRERIRAARGRQFSPEVVDAFLVASVPEAFWLLLDVAYVPQYVEEMEGATPSLVCSLDELKSFAQLIANIVDAKSHFTAEHSMGVARLARMLGSFQGFHGDHLVKMEIAAMLHDIGKLQVPDTVLESPNPLTVHERAIIKRHSFATYQILKRVGGFDELSMWAAQHHECLNGKGYPFRLTAEQIPIESRIIKIADVYQALAQKRPYRDSMSPAGIMMVLEAMESEGELDTDLVKMVARNLTECHREALGAA